MAANLHVSINAETIATLGPIEITNSMFTGVIVTALIVGFALYFNSLKLSKKKPGILQNIVEVIIEGIYKLCTEIAGEKKGRDFFAFIASSMIFIVLNNWIGLLPGVGTIVVEEPIAIGGAKVAHASEELVEDAPSLELIAEESHNSAGEETMITLDSHQEDAAMMESEEYGEEASHSESDGEAHHVPIPVLRAATADLNATIALALISMFLVQYYGIKYQGGSYFKKFFNFSDGPIFTFVGLLELLSDISKIISFAFRLFGNIFAGEVLLAVIAFLLPVVAPIPFLGLEIFVGFVQALVFSMLSLVFINMATHSHDH